MFRSDWDQLLLRARAGDEPALAQLLEVARRDLRGAAEGVIGRTPPARSNSEDVFADALVAVVKEIRNLRATNYVGFRYWFASIVRNHLRRSLRNEQRQGSREEGDESAFARIQRVEEGEGNEGELRRSIARLPRSQRIAYTLREGLELSWETIGFVLERRAPPAARLIHYRAGLRVRAYFESHVRPDRSQVARA